MSQLINIEVKDIDFKYEDLENARKELMSETPESEKYQLFYIPQSSSIDIRESFFPEREKIEIDENSVKITGFVFLSESDNNRENLVFKLMERDDLSVNYQPIEGPTFIRKLNKSILHMNTSTCIFYFDKSENKRKVIRRNLLEEKLNFYIDFSNNSAHFHSDAQKVSELQENNTIGGCIYGIILEIDVKKEKNE